MTGSVSQPGQHWVNQILTQSPVSESVGQWVIYDPLTHCLVDRETARWDVESQELAKTAVACPTGRLSWPGDGHILRLLQGPSKVAGGWSGRSSRRLGPRQRSGRGARVARTHLLSRHHRYRSSGHGCVGDCWRSSDRVRLLIRARSRAARRPHPARSVTAGFWSASAMSRRFTASANRR